MPRRAALRLAGATIVGVWLAGFRAPGALAQGCGAEQTCTPATQFCRSVCCPSSTTCCYGPPDPASPSGCVQNPHCCDPCDPSGSKCLGDGYCGPGPVADNCVCDPDKFHEQCGSDCCREGTACCDRTFTTKAPHCCPYEDAEKEACKDGEVSETIIAVAAGVAAIVFTGGTAAFGLAGGAAGLGAVGFKICGDDPPDPRYKALFRPRVPRAAAVRPGKGVTAAAAAALNRMIANRLRSGAYTVAWIRSIEKAQGADKVGDKTWARRHRAAAAGYAREAAAALERDKSLSTAARRELQRSGFRDIKVTLAQARQWQQRVRQRGLPLEMTRVLRAAGVDDRRIAAYRAAVVRLDPKLVAGVGVFGNLTDRRLVRSNAAMVKALRRSTRTLSSSG